jgi:hypothetical protein
MRYQTALLPVATTEGLEPSTLGVENRRSIQLSYVVKYGTPTGNRTLNGGTKIRSVTDYTIPHYVWHTLSGVPADKGGGCRDRTDDL